MVLQLSFAETGSAAENDGTQYYKMLSSVEYAGKGQFGNQVETLFTVEKQSLSDDEVRYLVSTKDFQSPLSGTLSFVVDSKTGYLSGGSEDLAFLEQVSNNCLRSLKKVTKKNIGQTWRQSFNVPSLGGELRFALTAIEVKSQALGEMIAVSVLSGPFVVRRAEKDEPELIQFRINTLYLFDAEIEDIYLSISVFKATANINGSRETLRHEVATYKTNAVGVPVGLNGVGEDFEKLVSKLGMARKSLKVVKELDLPQWGRSEGLRAAQIANICASTACEGGLDPVATVCMPAARTVALQSSGELLSATAQFGAAPSEAAEKSVFQKMSSGLEWNLSTAAIVGGSIAVIAISAQSSARSPSSP